MAQAAWECADPGIQYDGTINGWHTCPESGRITASNPCSEYVHLDNSSCNLASINLLKFLRDDDTFDVERFRQITETTRAYRQLGIGYANLGALLMATGHAYDSEDGRAIAAAITSLMTGTIGFLFLVNPPCGSVDHCMGVRQQVRSGSERLSPIPSSSPYRITGVPGSVNIRL